MKVAIVHDWLNAQFGGAEDMAAELAALFPEAPVYTLLYDAQAAGHRIPPERIRTSFLQKLPRWLRRRPRYLLPLVPMAIEQFDLSDYDLVISSSTAWAKGVITSQSTLHICYCYSPMRFVWDYWPAYLEEQHVGPLRRAIIHRLTSRLRLWDYSSSSRPDRWVAISQTVADRIQKYYRRPADAIIYSAADISQFHPIEKPKGERNGNDGYFVTLGRLTPYKKIDVAIAACNKLGRRLVVIGGGGDRARLQRLAGPTVEFAGAVDNARRAELLAGADALIFPNVEDFGLAPVEAMASGTPVIAYRAGGVTETVRDGVTGLFFDELTVDSLADALQRFNRDDYDTAKLTEQANKFSTTEFRRHFRDYVERAYRDFKN